MGQTSKIEWTDSSWSPIRARLWAIQNDGSGKERIGWHCEHVSEGCRNCYAESINMRLGTGFEFKPGNLRGKPGYYGGGIDWPELFLDEKMLLAPLRWKKPRMIFVCSMTDLFADFVKDEWIDRIFAVMALCPQHTFQVLTKRAGRMMEYFSGSPVELCERIVDKVAPSTFTGADLWTMWPLPNVWLGVSAERQQEADERIPDLLQTPAAVRFVSLEPLLGAIDLTRIKAPADPHAPDEDWVFNALSAGDYYKQRFKNAFDEVRWDSGDGPNREHAISWVIVGGESGRRARPMEPPWVADLREQCTASEVPFFFKQWGGANKKAAGRLLDGIEHNGMPHHA